MQKDLFGKKRYKVNLHMHTTLSDGNRSPEDVLAIYREQGYDAVALTDHWHYSESYVSNGLTVISGAEYNIGGSDCGGKGVYHILGVGCGKAPALDDHMGAQEIIDGIHAEGGLAVLAHPAWSLNTPEAMMRYHDIDATEIYNTVSGVHMSRRPDSSLIVDMLASKGCYLPLLATDDAHYYDNDHCVSWIMAEAENHTQEALLEAVRNGRFYASQGPEVHLYREGDEYVVRCSPCKEIVFFSNVAWAPRVYTGENLTEARFSSRSSAERYLRAEVTDQNGKRAWTNILPIR